MGRADEETRLGRWIVKKDKYWKGEAVCACSECRYGFAMGAYFEPDLWRFCPMCGAKMEVDANLEQ